jgi:HNH endonuclease
VTADGLISAALGAGAWTVDTGTGIVRSTRFADRRQVGCLNTKGYVVATLHFGGLRVQAKLHRVVWIAAHGAIPAGLVPDHVNRIKSDNRLENLRLVTDPENVRNRRSYVGEGNPACRLTRAEAIQVRCTPGSYSDRARRFGVSKSLVAQISRGELWK